MRASHPGHLIVAACLGLMAAFVVAGGKAEAAVSCGDTITTDTTLHHNLVNCPHDGIIVGADNVTLDLNGHTIDGDGVSSSHFCECGVWNQGHDGVTVRDGSLREFDAGVLVAKESHNRLLGLSASRNGFSGIFFFRCDRCLLRNSAGNRTKGFGDQVGMFMFQSHHDRILHNTFRGNVGNGTGGSGGGIASRASTNTVIRGNLMSRNGEAGIILEESDGFRISHNRLVRNHDGILGGRHNVITRNHVFGGGDGITIEGNRDLVAHNVVARTRRYGIRLGTPFSGGECTGGAHNLVRRNLVRHSREDGFLVGKQDCHSRLKGNIAKRSGDDGFDIESSSATLTRNRAVRNKDLGIEAVPGVIDGGGNIARYNGDPRQCTNIVCS